MYTSNRHLSQCTTSFIGTYTQGIPSILLRSKLLMQIFENLLFFTLNELKSDYRLIDFHFTLCIAA